MSELPFRREKKILKNTLFVEKCIIILHPFYIKLELIKNVVKDFYKNGGGFKHF